jgi:hypothetical protein
MSHAYFLSMGGFMLLDHAERDNDADPKESAIEHPLCPDEFLFLLRMAYVDLPKITQREIKDRSKGDILSKSLTVMQVGWFVIQCVVRRYKGLAITELELTTAALALTNTATYLFWWNKPLNVKCTVPIPLKRPISSDHWRTCMHYIHGPQLEEDAGPPDECSGVVGFEDEGGEKPESRVPLDIPTVSKEGMEWQIVLFESVRTAYAMEQSECQLRLKEKRVHRQYAGNLPQPQLLVTFLIAGLLGTTFAAIHYVAWPTNFSFPSEAERILWRVCCLVMVGVPCWLAVVFGLIHLFHTFLYPFRFGIRTSVIAIRYVYTVARLAMLVQMFVSLRSLPPAAYQTVRWITFLPHI